MTVAASRMPDLVEIAEQEAEREAMAAAIAAAMAGLRVAIEIRDRAEASYKRAYAGCLKTRLKAFSEATHAVIKAEKQLADLQGKAS